MIKFETKVSSVRQSIFSFPRNLGGLGLRSRRSWQCPLTGIRRVHLKSTTLPDSCIILPNWDHTVYSSTRHTEKKSVFMAHASKLTSQSDVPLFLEQLTTLPTLKRATHCMYAFRTMDNSKSQQLYLGQNDGGEKGSGERLSKLLEMSTCQNVIIVVSRWYGGVKLGSTRWKMISGVAKEALQKGGFSIKETTTVQEPIIRTKAHKKKR